MPANHTFAALCARLNRSPLYVRGLQRRFGLPIPADSPSRQRPGASARANQEQRPKNEERGVSYTPPYFCFLETIIHLRVLGISEDTLLKLWTLERKLMQLLHADSTGSPTWFLDACGSTVNPDHRLLLSNFDIGVYLPSQEPTSPFASPRALRGGNQEQRTKNQEPSATLQLGLNFAGKKPNPELFTAPEMGEDAILVLRQYQSLHQEILTTIHSEAQILRTALKHFSPMTNARMTHDALSRKPRPKPKNQIGSLIPGEI